MKAVSGPLPAGGDWVFEVKWDGMRAVAEIAGGAPPLLQTVNGKDASASFPELAGLGAALGVRDAILDGEIVAFADDGRPDFGLLQQRMHVTDPRTVRQRAAAVPCVYVIFDLLSLEGTPTTDLPWADRRRLLEALVETGPHWQVPPVHTDGAALYAAAVDASLEGIVAKRTSSTYRPGTRSGDWIKVKVRRRQEFVVGGWAPGTGSRSEAIGGLLIGYHPATDTGHVARRLHYAGRVGSGLSGADLDRLARRFADTVVADCPFDPAPPRAHAAAATWVAPTTVVEVAYAEWTADGRLRHPSYCGERIDVDPDHVTAQPGVAG